VVLEEGNLDPKTHRGKITQRGKEDTWGEHHTQVEARLGVMHLKARRCQGFQATSRHSQEAGDEWPPEPLEETNPANTLTGLWNCERTNFCCFKLPHWWKFVMVASGN
jgi:hypothetical protein